MSQLQVMTSCSLPPELATRDIPLEAILNNSGIDVCDKTKVVVGVSKKNGYLSFAYSRGRPTEKLECSEVVKHLKVADDCHSYNMVISRGCADGTVRLSTTRPMSEGTEVALWFAPEILAAIHVPFLTPVNIKGEKNYTCHKCSRIYEYPNPLKMHLSLEDCSKSITIENVLRKLRKHVEPERSNIDNVGILSACKTSISNCSAREDLSHRLNVSTAFRFPRLLAQRNDSSQAPRHPLLDAAVFPRCRPQKMTPEVATPSRCSAFQPYRQRPSMPCRQTEIELTDLCHNDRLAPPVFVTRPDAAPTLGFPAPSVDLYRNPSPETFRDEIDLLERRAVDMETLVSNLGKLKHGHLCLYCGKVYSRKYGLKIHIRTHTGFKPLKCKYCLRPFGDPSNLNKHVRLHAEGETPYRCELCNKVLVRRRDLERHMKSRHQTSPVSEDTESTKL